MQQQYLIPVPQGDKIPEPDGYKGSHLSNFRGKYLKVQSPVSRLPYLEVRKQEMESGRQ